MKTQSLIAALSQQPPEILRSIKKWFSDGQLSYRVIQQRLQEQHQVKVSTGTLCRYYRRLTGAKDAPHRRHPSRLASLKPEQRKQLEVWLVDESRRYLEIKKLVADRFNVKTSASAISDYWVEYARHRLRLPSAGVPEYTLEHVLVLRRQGKIVARISRPPEPFTCKRRLSRREVLQLAKATHN